MTYPVRVALLPRLADAEHIAASEMAVVIDTLRFTTTACEALRVGAADVLAIRDVADARAYRDQRPAQTLLCGERECRKIEGFDLGNSPTDYPASVVAGKTLVFTTTNGTRAVAAVADVPLVVLAGLTNRSAAGQVIQELPNGSEVVIVCAGTDGQVAMEDVLAAGAILESGASIGPGQLVPVGDSAHLALAAWSAIRGAAGSAASQRPRIAKAFEQYLGGANLVESGFSSDLPLAADVDSHGCIAVSCRDGVAGVRRFSAHILES